jgi:ABC-type sugar transport system ATPase subunit
MTPSLSREILNVVDVTKNFGSVQALKGCSLSFRSGEVHALVGVNGAGKSTLSRIVSGHITRTSGSIRFKDQDVEFASPREAIHAGISLVMQETSIAADLSVLENICLTEFGKPHRLDWKSLERKSHAVLEELGQAHRLPLRRRAGDLSMAQRQMVEICRALQQNSDIIIFDEPTASFSPAEVEHLFTVMRLLCERGHALGFVSHRMEEIFEITDRVTVMREGRTIESSLPTTDLSARQLIQMMVGRDIADVYDRGVDCGETKALPGPVVLEVEHLAVGTQVKDVSFTLRAGEVLGLAGLVGAGRSETLEAIFGLRRRRAGTVRLHDKAFDPQSPREASDRGIGFIGEDRRRQSIVPDLSVKENILLAYLGADRAFRTHYERQEAEIEKLLIQLDLPEHIRFAPMLGLSGGQQQKTIFARWLLVRPSVLLLDEPTRGVDIGTRQVIYRIIHDIARRGVGVVVVSSDFEETIGLTDRIVVLSDGVTVVDAPTALLDTETLTMFSAPRSSAQSMRKALQSLAGEYGGSAYWLQLECGRVFCIDVAESPGAPASARSLGMTREKFPLPEETAIPLALSTPVSGSAIVDAGFVTVLHRLTNRRGHAFGWIGVTVPATRAAALVDCDTRFSAALDEHGIKHIQISSHREGAFA